MKMGAVRIGRYAPALWRVLAEVWLSCRRKARICGRIRGLADTSCVPPST